MKPFHPDCGSVVDSPFQHRFEDVDARPNLHGNRETDYPVAAAG